jgi:hypothetical protein
VRPVGTPSGVGKVGEQGKTTWARSHSRGRERIESDSLLAEIDCPMKCEICGSRVSSRVTASGDHKNAQDNR